MGTSIHGTQKFNAEKRKNIKFSEESMKVVQKIISNYPEGKQKSALLPVLHVAQAEFEGWLSPEVMDYVAEILKIKAIEVYEVASFYSMYNLKPVGKCLLEVCQTSSCWMNGSEEIVKHLEKKLGIKNGETTKDGMFTIKTVECLGACGYAPMLQCGAEYHQHLTTEKIDSMLEGMKENGSRKNYTDIQEKNVF